MHGEYKTPGGKMVVVDFMIEDQKMWNVQVSGDFFLYPEEALADIVRALEGTEATAEVSVLTMRIQHALAPDVTLLGFSPEAIALTIGKALSTSEEISKPSHSSELSLLSNADAPVPEGTYVP